MTFPQIQTITAYSLLASMIKIPDLVQRAKGLGYRSVGISDKNVLYGAVEFYEACQKENIQPLLGMTLEYSSDSEQGTFDLLLLAKNFRGYQNLMRISSDKMEQAPNEPFFLERISENCTDLFAITPGRTGELEQLIAVGEAERAEARCQTLRGLFDEGAFFGSVSVKGTVQQTETWQTFASKMQLPLAALNEVRYFEPEDEFALQVLEHIEAGTKIDFLNPSEHENLSLPSVTAIEQRFAEWGLAEAVQNSERIAAQCHVELLLHQRLLPHYPVAPGETAEMMLRRLCEGYLPQRVPEYSQAYAERLQMELAVIHEMGFDDYFLIVWDVMDYAHHQKIVTGAGRGSAAGSLVSYVLSITDVDPIKYNLLFERFLNKERYTMPDIDLDIPDNRREDILQYVAKKYGYHHVAQIATFGTMAAKMVLRDVSRVFGLTQNEASRWANAVPNAIKITLPRALQESRKLQQLADENPRNKQLLDTAMKLEGLPRHVSTHAAGVVISDRSLLELVPLQAGTNDILLTQYTMNDVEKIGLLKMDFLGLRNLSIIDDTLKAIKRVYHEELQLNQIPLDDEKTLRLFQNGQTAGIFQFESAGIRNVLRKLQPTSIEDIAAVNALYRPGPMENIDLFIRRKHGQETVIYPDPILEDILKNTYGVIVYQEQIMQVASAMAGFTLGQADILRRAVSKKKKAVLDEERQHFVTGALQQGHSEKTANEIYDYIERFANYGFNRSHAFAYSFIGFQMAYLKVHYPGPFYTALLNSVRHSLNKVKEYIAEARKNRLKIAPPSINHSEFYFSLTGKDEIRFGFSSLKGIRRDFIKNIIDERRVNGRYQSFDQFLMRIEHKWLKPDNIEPLILIGAFDELNANRRQLINGLAGNIQNVLYSGGSKDLWDMMALKEQPIGDYTIEEKLAYEEQYLGSYLSGHPTEKYPKLRLAKQVKGTNEAVADKKIRVLLYVKEVREIRTKKGESMAFLEGSDDGGEISVTIFPKLYRKVAPLNEKQVYYIEGKVERSKYNQNLEILADQVMLAGQLEDSIDEKQCYLRITEELDQPETLVQIKEILSKHAGHIPVILFFEKSGKKIVLSDENWIDDSKEVQKQLSYILGTANIAFK